MSPRLRLAAGVALAVWLVLPLVPLAIWSVAHGWRFPALLPPDLSLKAWAYALSPTSGVVESFGVTLLIAVAVTLLAALIGLPVGRVLGLHAFRGRGLVLLLVLAPAVLPAVALAPGLHALFLHLGLAGTMPGVVLAHLIPALPYMVLVLAAVFAGFDTEAEDQARLLGAGRWQVFRHVTLPAVRPGLVTGGLFAFLVSWSQYLLTLAIGGGRVETLPLVLYSFASSGRNDVTGAVAVLYVLPGLAVLAVTARHLTGRGPGLAAGLMR